MYNRALSHSVGLGGAYSPTDELVLWRKVEVTVQLHVSTPSLHPAWLYVCVKFTHSSARKTKVAGCIKRIFIYGLIVAKMGRSAYICTHFN